METRINLESVESKVGARGAFTGIKTNRGLMACFDAKVSTELLKHVGKDVSVEVVTNEKGFSNIKKFFQVFEDLKTIKEEVMTPHTQNRFAEQSKTKATTMYVSYAKDLFMMLNAGKTDNLYTMEHCCEIIKVAIEKFKDL